MTEQELLRKYFEYKEEEKVARNNAEGILDELVCIAPHRVGEIVKWVETDRYKNVGGSIWSSKYMPLPDKERMAVVTKVEVFPSKLRGGDAKVRYDYTFSPITVKGSISKNHVYPSGDIVWTGEIHEDYIKNEK